MAENNAAEVEAKAEASFGEGFGTAPAEKAETVVETPVAEPVATPATAEPAPTPAAVPEKPKYARVLQSDFDNLKAAAGKVSSLESAVAKLTGSIGNTEQLEQRIVEKVRSQTPLGLAVEFSDEDFAELADAVPEIAKLTRTSLERIFKKAGVRGTGAAASPQIRDEDVEKGVERALQKREMAALSEAYPEWATMVGVIDAAKGEKPDETNEFRQWLDKQDEKYREKINNTTSPAEVRSALDKYTASKTAPATQPKPDRAAARRAIMEDAVAPRADGSPPTMSPPPSVEDAFASGFKRARA